MLGNASPLELVLLFLVAVIGLPCIAITAQSVASVVVFRMRRSAWERRRLDHQVDFQNARLSDWPDVAGGTH